MQQYAADCAPSSLPAQVNLHPTYIEFIDKLRSPGLMDDVRDSIPIFQSLSEFTGSR